MNQPPERDWARRLRPLVLGAEPLEGQLRRRGGATLVAASLLTGMALFLLAVFAGFGRPRIGLALGLPSLGVVALIGTSYGRLRRTLLAYRRAHPANDEPPPARPSSG